MECGRQEHRLKHGVVGDLGREVLKALMNKRATRLLVGHDVGQDDREPTIGLQTVGVNEDDGALGDPGRVTQVRFNAMSVPQERAGIDERSQRKVLRPLIAACSTTQRSRPAPCYPRQHHGR